MGIKIPAPPPPGALPPDLNAATMANPAAQQAEEAALQAEAEQTAREQQHIRQSYDRASNGLLPLSPDQIRDFMHRLEDTQKAAQPPSGGPPKGNVKLVTLSLAPGVDPPQINLAAGYVTTITIIDATGEPWPILDAAVGGNFEVSPTQASSHVVRIMPLTRTATGNLSVVLKELSTPIIFRLSAGGPSVDMRYDARVPLPGPGAKLPLIDRPRLEAGDETIILLLDNAPPPSAKRMKVNGVDPRTMAWMIDSHVYVRTPLTLLSPAWDASVSSADGMTVYEIGDAPVLLMSDNGAMIRARLLRDDDHDK
jgi:intracellular multiplication protein IcmK